MSNSGIIKNCLLLLTVVLVTACANSVVLGKVYDSFGSQTAKRFKAHAKFDKAQKQQIDTLAQSYHSWHRTTQLERYAEFLRRITTDIDAVDDMSFDMADEWWQSVRAFSDEMRECNPFNVSADLLSGLTDKQVSQMARHMRQELNEREDKYREENADARIKRRLKEITKWSTRAGITFNDAQTELLQKTLSKQISLGSQRLELRRIWIEEYILLLSQRGQADFKDNIMRHIDSVWRLTEARFPDEWRRNEQLWTGFIKDFVNLQTAQQRQAFVKKTTSIAGTFEKLAAKTPGAVPVCHRAEG